MTRPAHLRTPRRGHTPTRTRGRPHLVAEDPLTPGTCQTCHRPTGVANDMHVSADQLPGVDPDITAAERRRTGERDE